MRFSSLDIFFLILILLSGVFTAIKGFIADVLGKAAVFFGIGAAALFYGKLAFYITKFIHYRPVSSVLSFLLIFAAVYIVIKLLQHLLQAVFSGDILGGLDHTLGFFLGIIEGFILTAFIIILMITQPWFDFSGVLGSSFFVSLIASFITVPSNTIPGIFA